MSDIKIILNSSTQASIRTLKRRRTTAQALETSIDKWKAVVALMRGFAEVHDGGLDSCGLCHKFYKKNCHGCPVRLRTKQIQCMGSPYEEWDGQPLEKQKLSTAIRELKFLESLRK